MNVRLIHDKHLDDDILLLSAVGDDLLFKYFTVAETLGLHSPEIRFHDVLKNIKPASPINLELSRISGDRSLIINGLDYRGWGTSLGMGWTLFVYSRYLLQWLCNLLNLVWMALWMFPIGFWSQGRGGLPWMNIALLGSSMAILPAISGLAPTPPAQWVASILGFLVGISIRWKVRRRYL